MLLLSGTRVCNIRHLAHWQSSKLIGPARAIREEPYVMLRVPDRPVHYGWNGRDQKLRHFAI